MDEYWRNPNSAAYYGSAHTLHNVSRAHPGRVSKYLKEQTSYGTTSHIRPIPSNASPRFMEKGTVVGNVVECDLMYLSQYPTRYKYALILVDQLSSVTAARLLLTATARAVVRALDDILVNDELFSRIKVRSLRSDRGSEFHKEFITYCDDKGIVHNFTRQQSANKAAIVERKISTIRARLGRALADHPHGMKTIDFQGVFMNIVKSINYTVSDSLSQRTSPSDLVLAPSERPESSKRTEPCEFLIGETANHNSLQQWKAEDRVIESGKGRPYRVGQIVRVLKSKLAGQSTSSKLSAKIGDQIYTPGYFEVSKVHDTAPFASYTLIDRKNGLTLPGLFNQDILAPE
jgi:hypothetical protein